MAGPVSPPAPTLQSITAILKRRVSGILIVESEAWARMNVSGDVEAEFVFWPLWWRKSRLRRDPPVAMMEPAELWEGRKPCATRQGWSGRSEWR
jgi:hypothetical protein